MDKEKIKKKVLLKYSFFEEDEVINNLLNDTIDLTAKTILEEIEGKFGTNRSLYKNDEDITKGNLVIDVIEGGEIVCYIGLKRIVLLSLDLDNIKKQFGVSK